jgi:hypothetical protein
MRKGWTITICALLISISLLTIIAPGRDYQIDRKAKFGTKGFDPNMLKEGSVDPLTDCTPSCIITYTVVYFSSQPPKDVDTNLSSGPIVHVDGRYDFEMVSDYMHPTPAYTNGVFSDGEAYKITISAQAIATAGVIEHFYYFSAFDGTDDGRFPDTGNLFGPYFKPELTMGNVTPEAGTTNTDYRFQVTYQDISGVPPTWVHVEIDGVNYDMAPKDGNPDNILNGEIYEYRTKLDVGEHTYKYNALGYDSDLALGENSTHDGPIVRQGPLPDLEMPIEGVTLSTKNINIGTSVKIFFRIYNVGHANVPPEDVVNVSVFQGDPDETYSTATLIYSTDLAGTLFGKGAFIELNFTYVVPLAECRAYDLVFTVDRDMISVDGRGDVRETMDYGPESNNKLIYPLLAGPDLSISSVSPICAIKDAETFIVVMVTNIGYYKAMIPAGGIRVTYERGTTTKTAKILQTTTGVKEGPPTEYYLHPGDTAAVYLYDTIPASGEYQCEIKVDDTGAPTIGVLDEVVEYDYDNDGKPDPGSNNYETFTINVIKSSQVSPSFAPPIMLLIMLLCLVCLAGFARRR